MTLLILFSIALGLAYANGANDNIKACATVYGSRTLSYRGALTLATAGQVAGSIASVLLAGALIKAFSGNGLVPDTTVANPHFLMAVGIGGIGAVGIATLVGLPVSTTHALIGGLVGAGLLFAPHSLNWGAFGGGYFTPLLISPIIAVAAAGALYPPVSKVRKLMGIEASTRLAVEETLEPSAVQLTDVLAARPKEKLRLVKTEQLIHEYHGGVFGVSAQHIADAIHGVSAFALGFARSLNDTPKVIGILAASGWYASGASAAAALMAVAVAMAIGGLLHSRKLARTLGDRVTTMNHGQGLLANVVSSGFVIGASLIGYPISTTHVSAGAIFGIGVWTDRTNWKLVTGIVLAWVGTLPLGAAVAYGAGMLLGV